MTGERRELTWQELGRELSRDQRQAASTDLAKIALKTRQIIPPQPEKKLQVVGLSLEELSGQRIGFSTREVFIESTPGTLRFFAFPDIETGIFESGKWGGIDTLDTSEVTVEEVFTSGTVDNRVEQCAVLISDHPGDSWLRKFIPLQAITGEPMLNPPTMGVPPINVR